MKVQQKKVASPETIRKFLEPGPVVLISSAHRGERNIMTCGWHMMLGFEPTTVGCYIWDENHSREMIRGSRECVINLPTHEMLDTVIGVGNVHAPDLKGGVDKFERFGLTAIDAAKVDAPMIGECYANFECELADAKLINSYSLFVFEVVKAHVARTPPAPKYPQTVHYRGGGVFMVSGRNVNYRRRFKRVNL
jgi:flavin reductase (DIM6/NTAB) family NADH-FMN oxidoreductase RutF